MKTIFDLSGALIPLAGALIGGLLAILGMCNAASNWHRKESPDIARTAAEFAQLVIEGMGKRPTAPRRRR